MSADAVADVITIADLAKRRGSHPSTARRWLVALHAEHGGILRRLGKGRNAKLYTTTTALARVAPELVDLDGKAAGAEIRARIAELRSEVGDLHELVTSLHAEFRELDLRITKLEAPTSRRPGRADAAPGPARRAP